MRTLWLVSLTLSAGTCVALAQEVRYPVQSLDMELGKSVVLTTQSAHVLWIGGDYCPTANGEGLRRDMGLDGRFTSGDVSLFSTCLGVQHPRVAMNAAGTFLVVQGMTGGIWNVMARLFDASWTPLDVEFAVNSLQPAEASKPDVTALQNGDFVVAWTRNPANFTDLYARIVKSDGTMPAPEVFVAEDPSDSELHENVITLASGNPMVIWLSGDAATMALDVRGRVFDANLNPLGGEVIMGTAAPNRTPRAAASPAGGIVVWEEPMTATSIVGRLIDANGSPVGSQIVVSTESSGVKFDAWCAMDGAGRSIVAWTVGNASAADAYAQRLDAAGNKVGPEFRVSGTTRSGQGGCRIGANPAGDFIVTWNSDHNYSQTFSDTYMRRYFFPVSLALAPGRGPSNPPVIAAVRPDGTAGSASFWAYGTNGYGANVGGGDLDGGGVAELLAGPGPSPVYGPHVRGFRADGTAMGKVSYYAYGTLKYGVRTAGAQVDGDAYDEVLTAPGEGDVFGPHVRGWSFDGSALLPIAKVNFFAYSTLKYGARASGGDVDGDGMQELLTGTGPGQVFSPLIRGWQYDGLVLQAIGKISFWAFNGPKYGATVSSADVESDGVGGYGDGFQEILAGVGPDPGGPSQAALFDYDGASVTRKYDVFPYPGFSYGVSVAGGDADAGDAEEVVTAPGPNPMSTADVVVWEWHATPSDPDPPKLEKIGPDQFTWLGPMTYGANVAVATLE